MMPKIVRKIGKAIVLSLPKGEKLADLFRRQRSHLYALIRRRRLQKHGLEILRLVHTTLSQKSDIVYFADFGTLLGFVRDGGFLKHDDDIDFSVVEGSVSLKELVGLMQNAGFSFSRGFLYGDKVTEIAFTYKKVGIDFFLSYKTEEGQYMQYYEAFDWSEEYKSDIALFAGKLCRPKLKGIEEISINGVLVYVPVNREELLAATYGKGWRIPNPTWQSQDANDTRREKLDGVAKIFSSPEIFNA